VSNVRWINIHKPVTSSDLSEIMQLALEAGENWVRFSMYSGKLKETVLILISFN
jgi:hypothetical protein